MADEVNDEDIFVNCPNIQGLDICAEQEKEPEAEHIALPSLSTANASPAKITGPENVNELLIQLNQQIQNIPANNNAELTPKGITVNLFQHQQYALTWFLWRESQFPSGGILADEMGLGKTVMILALLALIVKCKELAIASNKNIPDQQTTDEDDDEELLLDSISTLIVVPPALIYQWENEVESKTDLTYLIYHGPDRKDDTVEEIADEDIIITTYNVITSEIPKENSKKQSILEKISWKRIVVDEGHLIRNPKTHISIAINKLHSKHRWILTGTPIHNRPSDMFSLAKFLQISPLNNPKVWDKYIGLKTIREAATENLQTIAKAIILRRSKEEVDKLAPEHEKLPTKIVQDVIVEMNTAERNVYNNLIQKASMFIKKFMQKHTEASEQQQEDQNKGTMTRKSSYSRGIRRNNNNNNNTNEEEEPGAVAVIPDQSNNLANSRFSNVLLFLLRLRQASVLPYLILPEEEDNEDNEDKDENTTDNQAQDSASASPEEIDIPDEYKDLIIDDIINHSNPIFDVYYKSAKIDTLLRELEELKYQSHVDYTFMDKIIIVSQWTKLLKILGHHIQKLKLKYDIISGDVSLKERNAIMNDFNNPKRHKNCIQILLLSLTAGGTGLNLIGGNRMYFLDLHWNPQLELQAHARIHRYGQKKNVIIKRFITKDSLEQRVIELQSKKLILAGELLNSSNNGENTTISEETSGTYSASANATQITLNDVKQLFDL